MGRRKNDAQGGLRLEETTKKNTSPNWGGRRKGAGAKRRLPPGARVRSVKMTDEEYEKVKEFLKSIRIDKRSE